MNLLERAWRVLFPQQPCPDCEAETPDFCPTCGSPDLDGLQRSGFQPGGGSAVSAYQSGGTDTAGLIDNAVTNAKLRDSGALSVIGRSANSVGDPADIAAAAASGAVLRESGSLLGFGTVVAAGIAADAVTTAKILDANVTVAKLATAAKPHSIIAGFTGAGLSAGSNFYHPGSQGANELTADATKAEFLAPRAGVLKNLRAKVADAALGVGVTVNVFVRIERANSALTAAFAANAAADTVVTDLVNAPAVAAGDRVSIHCDASGPTAAGAIITWSFEWEAT